MIQPEPTQTQESFTEAAKNINRTASISFPPDDGRRGEATYCNPVEYPAAIHIPWRGLYFCRLECPQTTEYFPPGWDWDRSLTKSPSQGSSRFDVVDKSKSPTLMGGGDVNEGRPSTILVTVDVRLYYSQGCDKS